jgi:hypothetical protein
MQMQPDNEDLQLIEKFIDGELSIDERKLFQERMNDEAFAKQLHFQRAVTDSVRIVQEQELKKKFKQRLEQQRMTNETGTGESSRRNYYWAAAVLVIALASTIFIVVQQPDSSEKLYLAYYQPYPVTGITRDGSEEKQDPAVTAYGSGDYRSAAFILEAKIAEATTRNAEELKLILGNCYLQLGEQNKAALLFKQVMQSDDPVLKADASWYFALAQIRMSDVANAKVTLQDLMATKSAYRSKAAQLLDDLD